MRSSGADKLIKHERQKAKLAEEEHKFREKARKQRHARVFNAGEMVERTGLLSLPAAALYGGLLWLQKAAAEEKMLAKWSLAGNDAFAREAAEREKVREPILIVFDEQVTRPTRAALYKAGFKYNSIFKRYEGLSTLAEGEALAVVHQGVARRATEAQDAPGLALAAE